MHNYNHPRDVQNYNAHPSTSALDGRVPDEYWLGNGIFTALNNNFEQKSYLQPQVQDYSQSGDVNPEDFSASQITPPLTDGSPVEGWQDNEETLKTPDEDAVIPPWAGDYFNGGPLKIVAPLPSNERVEACSQDDDTYGEDLDSWLSRTFNLRPNANSNDQSLEPENNQLPLSTNVANPLPTSQVRDNFAEFTGELATATSSADYYPPGPSSSRSVDQINAALTRTSGPASGFFGAPPNYGQRPSYPQFMGQAVVALDTPDYFLWANAPISRFPMAGSHQSIYGQQPRTAPATMSHHRNAQMGFCYFPYNPVAQAAVPPNMQAYAGASMPVYEAYPPFTQTPITRAFPVYKRQPRNSSATMSAQAARRDRRHQPYGTPSVSKRTEMSGKADNYCQWGDCSAGPMTLTKIREHFRDHGEKVKGHRIKECLWKGCNSKPGAFPMTREGFRRHVYETGSHAGIGRLSKVNCEKCGEEKAKRSQANHSKVCSGESKEREEEVGLMQHY